MEANPNHKTYLGTSDGAVSVYADTAGTQIILTATDGYGVTHRIPLDREVVEALVEFAKAQGVLS